MVFNMRKRERERERERERAGSQLLPFVINSAQCLLVHGRICLFSCPFESVHFRHKAKVTKLFNFVIVYSIQNVTAVVIRLGPGLLFAVQISVLLSNTLFHSLKKKKLELAYVTTILLPPPPPPSPQ